MKLFLFNIIRNVEQKMVTANLSAIPLPSCWHSPQITQVSIFLCSTFGSWIHRNPPGNFSKILMVVVLLPLANHCSGHGYVTPMQLKKIMSARWLLGKVLTDLKTTNKENLNFRRSRCDARNCCSHLITMREVATEDMWQNREMEGTWVLDNFCHISRIFLYLAVGAFCYLELNIIYDKNVKINSWHFPSSLLFFYYLLFSFLYFIPVEF